jgi:hypothetical protein
MMDWSASAGWSGARQSRATFRWAAPERGGRCTITAVPSGGGDPCSIDLDVIEPSGIVMRRVGVLGYPAGSAGAGMQLDIRLQPRTVNFGWIAIMEDPGPASGVSGYFATRAAAGANLAHVPNPAFSRVSWNNNVCCDTAATAVGSLTPPPAWAPGTFSWRIPTRYQQAGSTSAGRVFTTVTQRFAINAAGTVTVSKHGQTVTRTP